MAVRKKQVEWRTCDMCNGDDRAYDRCIVCNHDVCYACKQKGRILHDGVLCDSGYDEVVCEKCVADGRRLPETEKVTALLEIERLRREYKGFMTDFDARRKAAEARVEACR